MERMIAELAEMGYAVRFSKGGENTEDMPTVQISEATGPYAGEVVYEDAGRTYEEALRGCLVAAQEAEASEDDEEQAEQAAEQTAEPV